MLRPLLLAAVASVPFACMPFACMPFACMLFASTTSAAPAAEVGAAEVGAIEVAAVQYPIEGRKGGEAIAAKVEGYVRDAKAAGADIVVLPELLTYDAWPFGEGKSDTEVNRLIARTVTPGYFAAVKRIAAAHKVMIVGGSSPRLDKGRVFNTAIVAFADGRVVFQDKVNLTHWEAKSGLTGGDELRPFDTPWGRAIVLICYDVEFPTLSTALIDTKPLLWFVPSMTDTEHGLQRVRWSAQTRAVEHHAFVVVTGTVGTPAKTFPNVGQAAFLTPRRESFPAKVTEGPRDAPGLVHAVLDVAKLRASRAAAKLYPAKDAAGAKRRTPVRLQRAR